MQAERTVTVYGGNRLDQAREVAPRQLAEEFIEAVRNGYFKEPCGRGGEWAYRLWLSAPDGANVAWDEGDEDVLLDALRDALAASEETRDMVILAVWGDDAT